MKNKKNTIDEERICYKKKKKKKEKEKEEINTSQQEKLSTKLSRVYFEYDLIFYSYCQIYKNFNYDE